MFLSILNSLSRDDERGQGLAEYALILALIAIIAIAALVFLGGEISRILSTIGDDHLEDASSGQTPDAGDWCQRRPTGSPRRSPGPAANCEDTGPHGPVSSWSA